VILCPGDLWALPTEEFADGWMDIAEAFVLSGRDGSSPPRTMTAARAAYLRDICEQCIGMPAGDLPEDGLVPGPGQYPGGAIDAPECNNWVGIGPRNISCVIRALAADPIIPGVLYAGAEFGGVWATGDGGAHWHPTMNNETNLHVGAIALCRTHPDII